MYTDKQITLMSEKHNPLDAIIQSTLPYICMHCGRRHRGVDTVHCGEIPRLYSLLPCPAQDGVDEKTYGCSCFYFNRLDSVRLQTCAGLNEIHRHGCLTCPHNRIHAVSIDMSKVVRTTWNEIPNYEHCFHDLSNTVRHRISVCLRVRTY